MSRLATLKYKQFIQSPLNLPEFDTVEIEGKRHYNTPVGALPSVTTVLSAIGGDDSGLKAWRKRVGEEEADRIVNESAGRGSSMHEICEKYLLNQLKQGDGLKGQGGALFKLIRPQVDTVKEVLATEVCLYSAKYKYAGRGDFVCILEDKPGITFGDFKNARKPIAVDRYDYCRRKLFVYYMQITGYSIALEEMTGLNVSNGVVIVGNYLTSNSDRFIFKVDDFYRSEWLKIVDAYHRGETAKDSFYHTI